jgi:hypothetical protein
VSFALGKYMLFFFGSLRRVYLPEVTGALATFFGRPPGERRERRRRSRRQP